MSKTLGQIARDAYREAFEAEVDDLWGAIAKAVAERCAQVADIWADTKPTSGELAPLIATVTSTTGKKIAEQIRSLINGGEDA